MKKVVYITFFVLFLAIIGGIFYREKIIENKKTIIVQETPQNDNSETQKNLQEAVKENTKKESEKIEEKNIPIPDTATLEVPFLSQAPFAKWDALHEDACEEASLIMAKYFLDGEKTISKEQGEKEIQDMVKFENRNKYGLSVTLDELNEIARKYYDLERGRVEKNITIENIKKELASGKPVIVGAAGKVLPNPNFKNGGPNYHMLVIIGYDGKGFITNDPGTRLGKNFRYTFEDLLKSIHDWNPKNILNGEKNYLVFD